MVGKLPTPDSTGGKGQESQDIHILSPNFSLAEIRRLIQGSLEPLLVDPIPTRVVIDNIKIFLDSRGELGISCEVSVW